MNISCKAIIASSLSILLSTSLLASEVYNIESSSLHNAIKKISKISNMTYMGDTRILEGKTSPTLNNVNGVKNALKKVLKGTNLESVIKDGTIIIREKKINNTQSSNSLGKIDIIGNLTNVSENSNSYTIDSMSTATKLNLSIKDTPQSVTVVTNQNIIDNNLTSLDDVTNNIVGINSPVEDSERIWMSSRGFAIDYYQIDGIPTNHEGETQQDMIMYDRVEIVRGANGLLSGAGNPAASINLIRKRANSKELKGNLSFKVGSWNSKAANLDLSTPLNSEGSIRARIIASKEDKESFRENYEKQRDVFYAVVDADIGENSKLSLGGSYQKDEAKGATWGGLPAFYSDLEKTDFDVSKTFAPKWATMPITTKTIFSNFSHTFDNEIKLNLNYSQLKSDMYAKMALLGYFEHPNKQTGLAGNYLRWIADVENKSSVFDMNTSIPFTFMNKEHELIAGISSSKREYTSMNRKHSNPQVGDIYDYANIDEWIPSGEPYPTYDNLTKEKALYIASRFSLSEDIKLITGARLTNWEYEKGKTWNDAFSYEHKNVFTPYLGLVYNLNQNHSLYASYTDIFKPQDQMDKNGKYLDPAEGKNFEVGLKGEYFDKQLFSSLTLFRIEQDNVAQADGSNKILGSDKQAFIGAEGVISNGVEFEVLGKVSNNLDINFAISHFDAKDKNDKDVSTISPRNEVKIASKYKINDLTLGASAKWKSDIYAESGSAPKIEEGNVLTVDAMLKYDFSKNFTAQMNVKNIFDKKYKVHFPYGIQYVYGEPRKVTFTLNYKF